MPDIETKVGETGAPKPNTESEAPEQPKGPTLEELQAQLETLKQRAEKAEKDALNYRSQEIATLKRVNLESKVDEMAEYLRALAEHNADPEFQQRWNAQQVERQKKVLTEQFAQERERVRVAVLDMAKELGVDADKVLEFKDVRTYWESAQRTGDIGLLAKAETELERAARKVEKERARQQLAEEKAKAEEMVKKRLQQAGVHDLAVEPAGATGGTRRLTRQDIQDYDLKDKSVKEIMEDGKRLLDQMFPKGR